MYRANEGKYLVTNSFNIIILILQALIIYHDEVFWESGTHHCSGTLDFPACLYSKGPSRMPSQLLSDIPSSLKLSTLGLHSTPGPKYVKNANWTLASILSNIGTPLGHVLSPSSPLCSPTPVLPPTTNFIVKFTNNTTVTGLIAGGDDVAYRIKVANLASWCENNNLALNTDKRKEIMVDMRRRANLRHHCSA